VVVKTGIEEVRAEGLMQLPFQRVAPPQHSSNRATIRFCSASLPQRGCVIQPRVARHELPWEQESKSSSTLTGLHRFAETVM